MLQKVEENFFQLLISKKKVVTQQNTNFKMHEIKFHSHVVFKVFSSFPSSMKVTIHIQSFLKERAQCIVGN